MSEKSAVTPSPGVKMMFPIRRREHTSREELIAYWFAHHMPHTINVMGDVGKGYIGTVYDDNDYPWDGVAQMFLEEVLETPEGGHGTVPSDSFHEHVQPYFGWATREYVVIDGAEHLPVKPLTLGDKPFPTSRSGFFKVTYMVKALQDADYDAFYDHWLSVHVPNVAGTLTGAGGFRYVVGLSLDPLKSPYAGMAELYFHDRSGWDRYKAAITDDGMSRWVDNNGTLLMYARTEFVAIP